MADTSPNVPVSIEDLRESVTSIQENIAAAIAASEAAMEDCKALYLGLNKIGAVNLPRFNYEVMRIIGDISRDLGAEVDGATGDDYDLQRSSRDCLDLLDLIGLACSPSQTAVV